MDGVLADFKTAQENQPQYLIDKYKEVDKIPNIFKDLPLVDGAKESVYILKDKYDLFVATTASWHNYACASDKIYWIKEHFGDTFKKKMFITHRKDLLIGDYLIDDRTANGAKDFKGELIDFGWNYEKQEWNTFKTWNKVLKHLI